MTSAQVLPRIGSMLSRSTWVLWLVFAALCLGAGLGLRDPSPPDEPRFVLAARDMVESGRWLLPHRGRELYAEKPPVFMWLQAAAYSLVGDWRIAFLLPSLLAGLLTLALTADLARRLASRKVALYAAGALWVCLQFGLQAKRGQIDMVLVAMTTTSLWALVRHFTAPDGARWLALAGFAAGVGTVTKGVGFLPLLVLIPWAVHRSVSREPTPVTPRWAWLVLPAAFVAGTAVWLAPLLIELARTGDPELARYTRELLVRQTGERYANAWHHVQPAWYYLQVTATLWLPGALLLPWLAGPWLRALKTRDQATWLMLGWAALVLVFFSLSPGKREVYIFPALPALCVAAAPFLPGLLRRRSVQTVLAAYLALLGGVLLALGTSGLAGWSDWAVRLASDREIPAELLRSFLVWLASLGAIILALLAIFRRRRIGIALVLATGMLWSAYGLGLAPAVDASSSARAVMEAARRLAGPRAEIGLVGWREQNLLQAVPPVREFGYKAPWRRQWNEASAWARAAPDRRWIFFLKDAASPCVRAGSAIRVGQSNRRDWLMVRGRDLQAGCLTPPLIDEAARAP